MSAPSQASNPVSVAAGLAPLAAVPVAVLLLMSGLWRGAIEERWQEGGWGMFGCAVVAMAGSVGCGAAGYLAGRLSERAAGVVPLMLLLVLGVGGLFVWWGEVGSLRAVASAAQPDRGAIIAMSEAELGSLRTWASVLAGAMAATAALSWGLVALGRREPAFAVLAVGAVLLGGWLYASAWEDAALAHAWRALGVADPDGRVSVTVAAVAQAQLARTWALGVAAALAVVALAGALALRARPAVVVGVASLLVVAFVGAGALRLAAQPSAEARRLVRASVGGEALLDFDGPFSPPRATRALSLDEALREGRLAEVARRLLLAEEASVGVGLDPEVDAARLEQVLRTAEQVRLDEVVLLGRHREEAPTGVVLPEPFDVVLDSLRAAPVAFARQVGLAGCERCARAALVDGALLVDGERWPLVTKAPRLVDAADAPRVLLPWRAYEPALLVRAAMTAAGHGARLSLVVPPSVDGAAR